MTDYWLYRVINIYSFIIDLQALRPSSVNSSTKYIPDESEEISIRWASIISSWISLPIEFVILKLEKSISLSICTILTAGEGNKLISSARITSEVDTASLTENK